MRQQVTWRIAALVAWSVHAMPGAKAQPNAARHSGAQPLRFNPDNEPTLQELKTGQFKRYYYVLPVQNAEPDFLAWQLDPAHNKEPEMIAQSRRNLEAAEGGYDLKQWPHQAQAATDVDNGDGATTGRSQRQAVDDGTNPARPSINLPLGVDSVLPLAAQHALLVTATPGGAREIQLLAQSLDKAIAIIEIKSQVVEMSRDDAKTMGVEFTDQPTAHTGNASLIKANYSGLLAVLVALHKAKVIAGGHHTQVNNTAASVTSRTYGQLPDGKELHFQQVQMRLAPGQAPTDSHFCLVKQDIFTTFSTVNADGTIQLRYISCWGYALTTDQSHGLLPLQETQWLDTTVTLKDNATVAVTGLHKPQTPLPSGLLGYPTDEDAPAKSGVGADMEWVVFLTAHVVPRINQPLNADKQLERLEPKPVQP